MEDTTLLNCKIRNHISSENPLDTPNLDTLPSHVLIEIWPDGDADPPDDSPTGDNGFWAVSASNFNISGSTIPSWPGLSPSTLFDGQTSTYSQFATNDNVIIPIGNTNKGIVFQYSDMVDTVDGETNWNPAVEYVMFVDTEGGGTSKNKVFVYIKLINEYIIPGTGEDITINIDIDGKAVWIPIFG
tara:strand:- start:5876 stop:6433 length:558 start_codon:yes stop_codon:yes gene_type:complete